MGGATGRIEPISKVEIKSKANGIVKELKVEVGDRVRIGQVLVELDKDNLAARLRESRAALTGSQANLSAAEAEFEKNKVDLQSRQSSEIVVFPYEGSESRPLGVDAPSITHLTASPDGRRLAFASGDPVTEVWVTRNLLPKAPAAGGGQAQR